MTTLARILRDEEAALDLQYDLGRIDGETFRRELQALQDRYVASEDPARLVCYCGHTADRHVNHQGHCTEPDCECEETFALTSVA